MTAYYIFKIEGANDNSRGAVFTLDLLTQATCQQFCTLQELEVKAGRAEYRGEANAEGQESQEGCDVDRVEGDAQLATRSLRRTIAECSPDIGLRGEKQNLLEPVHWHTLSQQ